MEIMSTGFLLLNVERLSTYQEREYTTSDGRYICEMSINVSDNDEFDHLNQYWNFTEEQSRLFKAQETTYRVITQTLPTYDVETDTVHIPEGTSTFINAAEPKPSKTPEESQTPGVVSAVNDEDEDIQVEVNTETDSKSTGDAIKETLVTMGGSTSVHRENEAHTRSGRVTQRAEDYRCHEEEKLFQQRLLVHDIHAINEKSVKGDPSREKFTERAGVFYKRFSCPQLYLYLRDRHIAGRKAIDACYAKRWPYSKAQRSDMANSRRTDQENQRREGAARVGTTTGTQASTHRETKTFMINGAPREIPVMNTRLFSVAVDGVEIYNDVDGELPLPDEGRTEVVGSLKEDRRGETDKAPTSNRHNKTSND